MAFKIMAGEVLPDAVARMARKQLKSAFKALDQEAQPLGERVHEIRTSLKKARALTRLVRPDVGAAARRANRKMREIANSIGPARDAEVLIHAFEELFVELDASHSPSLSETQSRLNQRLREAAASVESPEQRRQLQLQLRRARRKVVHWIPRHRGWRAIGPGFLHSYQRARQAMEEAYRASSGVCFHEWRKAVKTYRYQHQALQALWPESEGEVLNQLEELGELLGREHDFTLLADTVHSERLCFAEEQDCARLLALIEERRGRIREQARPLGERLFGEDPKQFRGRVRAHFDAFREAADSQAESRKDSERSAAVTDSAAQLG